MKKGIILLVCFMSLHALSQTSVYKPFPETYANWGISTTYYPNNQYSYVLYYMNNDTLIGSYGYKKCYKLNSPYPLQINIQHSGGTYQFAYRNDSLAKKVFLVFAGQTNENLWYDFNISIGDTLKDLASNTPTNGGGNYPGNCYQKVDSIDSVLICGTYHKRYGINTSIPFPFADYIIEGFGYSSNFVASDVSSCSFEPYYLQSTAVFSHDDCAYGIGINTFSGKEKLFDVFPNPANKTISIKTNFVDENSEIQIQDVLGNKLLNRKTDLDKIDISELANGVYLITLTNGTLSSTKKLVISR